MGKKRRILMVLGVVAVLIFGVFAFTSFYGETRAYLRSICNTELADYAVHNAYSTRSELEKAVQLTQTASENFTDLTQMTEEEKFRKLKILAHDTPFENMTLCGSDGMGIDSAGGSVDNSDALQFQRAVYGESSITTFDEDEDGELEIVVCAPIITDGKVTGVIQGNYNSFDLSKIINVNSFEGAGYAALVESDGDVIVPDTSADNLNKNDENYWTFFEKAYFTEQCSYQQLLEDVENKKSGIAVYSVEKEQRELYYTPVGINDWYLLQMVTADVVKDYTNPMTRMVFVLVAEVACMLLILAVIFYYRMAISRKEKEAETERFRTLANNIPGGVAEILVGEDCQISYANDGFFQLMGYSRKEFMTGWIGGFCLRIVYGENGKNLLVRIKRQMEHSESVFLEYQIKRGDESVSWINMTGKVISHEKDASLVQAVLTDVTAQKKHTSEIMENAKRDKMTQLYDKVSVTDIVSSELGLLQSTRVDALIVLDIDNFKTVNDSYGHQLGDEAIIKITDTMKNTFRDSDIKGRIGGDEFLILMKNVKDTDNVYTRIHIFQENVRALELAGETGRLSCSVGGILIPKNQLYSFDEVFRQADRNLYLVKKGSKGSFSISEYESISGGEERTAHES